LQLDSLKKAKVAAGAQDRLRFPYSMQFSFSSEYSIAAQVNAVNQRSCSLSFIYHYLRNTHIAERKKSSDEYLCSIIEN
jgi:hypothetical protein